MVKKWRSCLSLLVSFVFILSMLFSATLEVKAAGDVSFVSQLTFTVNPNGTVTTVAGRINSNSGGGGWINNGSGTISSISGGNGSIDSSSQVGYTYHFKIPFNVTGSWTDFNLGSSSIYDFADRMLLICPHGFQTSSGDGNVSNVALYRSDGTFLETSGLGSGYSPLYFDAASNFQSYDNTLYNIPFILEFDYTFNRYVDATSNLSRSVVVNYSFYLFVRFATSDEIDSAQISVVDRGTQSRLDDLNTSTDAIKESTTNPNGTGILGTIKNFFNGFFGWLHDTILGLFVPSSDYFTTWFTNVNNLLSAKLGMLYAPLDLLISTLNAVYSASSDFSGVPFPEIKWGDTVLVSAQNLTFSNLLGEHFSDIQGYVYFGTDVVLLFAFLMLLQRKITLVLRGHESG